MSPGWLPLGLPFKDIELILLSHVLQQAVSPMVLSLPAHQHIVQHLEASISLELPFVDIGASHAVPQLL